MAISALFLDRDGTIIEDRHYLSDPEGVTLLPHAAEGLLRLHQAGIRLFIVTNQSGIGRGYFSLTDYYACEERLAHMLAEKGVRVVETAFCPHAPQKDAEAGMMEEPCACRKPNLGMWHDLQKKYNLKPEECAMVGDKMADVLFGLDAGFAASILVLTGKGQKTADERGFSMGIQASTSSPLHADAPHFVAKDLSAVADWLLSLQSKEK